jgi:hypothetical protein
VKPPERCCTGDGGGPPAAPCRGSRQTTELVSKPKQVVYDAYLKVKANKGAAGVDEESIEEFERRR